MRFYAAVVSAVLLGAACASRSSTVVVAAPPSASRASTAATLGIPPGHLPPPGRCRVWIPGRPPGHQPASRSCQGITRVAPAGAWILYRPSRDRRVVHVRHVHQAKAGVIVRVRVFEARSGKYLRDEG